MSGALLAVARAAGETAPLLFTIGIVTETNTSLFKGQNTALSVQIFNNAISPFTPAQDRAWGAALTLIVIVFVITIAGPSGDRLLRPPADGMNPEDGSMPTIVDPTANVIDVTTDVDAPSAAVDSPDTPAREEEPERERELVFELQGVEVRYSGHTAVREVDLDIAANEITAFIGPSGCGKTTVLRCLNRMHDLTPGAQVFGRVEYHGENLYGAEGRPRRGAPADRHGVPEAEPVPEDDLRQRRVRAEAQRQEALGAQRHRRARAARAPRCGTR